MKATKTIALFIYAHYLFATSNVGQVRTPLNSEALNCSVTSDLDTQSSVQRTIHNLCERARKQHSDGPLYSSMLAELFIERFNGSFTPSDCDPSITEPVRFDLGSILDCVQGYKGDNSMLRAIDSIYATILPEIKTMFCEMRNFIQQQFLSHVIHSELSHVIHSETRFDNLTDTLNRFDNRFDNLTDTLNNLWTNETEFTKYFNHQKIEETVIALKQLLSNPILFNGPLNRPKFHAEHQAKWVCEVFHDILELYLLICNV